jgi:hypothetical protein
MLSRVKAPHKTLYNRFIRWNLLGVLARTFAGLLSKGPKPEHIMTTRYT